MFQIEELRTNLMKKTEIILIGIIIVIITISGNQIYQDNLKIDFLENSLSTKNLHYEWLAEIINQILETGEIPDIKITEILNKT